MQNDIPEEIKITVKHDGSAPSGGWPSFQKWTQCLLIAVVVFMAAMYALELWLPLPAHQDIFPGGLASKQRSRSYAITFSQSPAIQSFFPDYRARERYPSFGFGIDTVDTFRSRAILKLTPVRSLAFVNERVRIITVTSRSQLPAKKFREVSWATLQQQPPNRDTYLITGDIDVAVGPPLPDMGLSTVCVQQAEAAASISVNFTGSNGAPRGPPGFVREIYVLGKVENVSLPGSPRNTLADHTFVEFDGRFSNLALQERLMGTLQSSPGGQTESQVITVGEDRLELNPIEKARAEALVDTIIREDAKAQVERAMWGPVKDRFYAERSREGKTDAQIEKEWLEARRFLENPQLLREQMVEVHRMLERRGGFEVEGRIRIRGR